MSGGIKRSAIRKSQRKFAESGGKSAEAWKPLGNVLWAVSSRNLPMERNRRRYTQGPALTWANISRLPEEEIATQIAMKYLKANVDHHWPRKVTYETFIENVQSPLFRGNPIGFNGRPINKAWLLEPTPFKILEQARITVAGAARDGETISIKDALEKFWTRRSGSGFRGLTRAVGLSAVRFQRKEEKKKAAKRQ